MKKKKREGMTDIQCVFIQNIIFIRPLSINRGKELLERLKAYAFVAHFPSNHFQEMQEIYARKMGTTWGKCWILREIYKEKGKRTEKERERFEE